MADSITFPFAIFRLESTGDTETSIANTEAVGMEIGLPTTETPTGLISYKPVADGRRTDVSNPDQTAPSAPDTGIVPFLYELEFIVNEKITDSVMLARLARFMLEPKISDDFPKGKIGIRYNAKSEFNINPELVSGGKIMHFDFLDDITWGGLVNCKVIVAFSGDPTTLLAALLAASS